MREGIAIFDSNRTPVGCNRRMCDLLHLEGDGLADLARLVSTHDDFEALFGGAEEIGLELPGGRLVMLRREQAGPFTLVHALEQEGELPESWAESRLEAVARLCDGMVHDARNPLNAIVLNVEVLSERLRVAAPEVRPGVEKYLKAIRDQVGRTDAIIRHFVAFARPERELQATGRIDLAQLVGQAVEVCRHDARKRNVRIDTRLDAVPIAAGTPELAHAILQLVMRGIDGSHGGTLQIALERQGADAVLQLTEAAGEVTDAASAEREPLHALARLVGRMQGNLVAPPDGRHGEIVVRLPAAGPPPQSTSPRASVGPPAPSPLASENP